MRKKVNANDIFAPPLGEVNFMVDDVIYNGYIHNPANPVKVVGVNSYGQKIILWFAKDNDGNYVAQDQEGNEEIFLCASHYVSYPNW